MEMNESATNFIKIMKEMHTASRLAICLLDDAFTPLWCNERALEVFPILAMQSPVASVLGDYDAQDVRDEIAQDGHFCVPADEGNLFGGHGMVIYGAPAECGGLYVMQPQELQDEGTGRQPMGISRSIAAYENTYRPPLASIFSTLALSKVQADRQEDPVLDEYLAQVGQYSMHMMRGTQMVSDYTKITSGLKEHKPRRMDLTAYLEKLLRFLEKELARGKEGFSYELPEGPVFAVTEEWPLQTIVCQLVSNGMKFTRPENHVHVKVGMSGGGLTVTVSDRGVGIAPEVAERMFTPYYTYNPETGGFAGTGLGLPLARECAAFLGGELTYTTIQGQGTVFRVALPLKDEDLPLMARSPEDDLDMASAIRMQIADCAPCERP